MPINRTAFFSYARRAPFGGRLTPQQVEGVEHIFDAWEQHGDTGELRYLAYILATAFHETGATMAPVREGFAKTDKAARKAVAKRKYSLVENGHVYYGRGLVQLTWGENYRKLGKHLGVDLYDNPDLALDPVISSRILVVGMFEGLFTGKRLEHFFGPSVNDIIGARKIINGTDKAHLIASYHEQFLGALQAADEKTPQPADVKKEDAEPDGKPLLKDSLTIGTMTSAAGGIGASLIAAVNNPWALAAVVVIGIGVVLFLTGRLQIRKVSGA
jgi:hypothetical protein